MNIKEFNKNNTPMESTFDFTKCLAFIETKGKELFNPDFIVYEED